MNGDQPSKNYTPEFRALDPSLKIEVCISNNNMEFDLTIKDNTSDID